MPTTPNLGLNYPDDDDWLGSGASSIEQLALDVDNQLKLHYNGTASEPATTIAAGGWHELANYTHTGGPAWVLVTAGATLAGPGTDLSLKELRVLANGARMGGSATFATTAGLSLCRIGNLNDGDTLNLQVAPGVTDASAYGWWLQVIRLGVG